MAVIWQKNVAGITHEVRAAGATLRLYTDGVFHSQYNPRYPVAGHLWDLLMLPAFFADTAKSVRRILVLGAGGGAVMQQLNYFVSPDIIIGIDNNPQHIYAARRFFGLQGDPFHLIEADAVQWLTEYNDEPFDLIIDDLYGEHNGEPQRAIVPDKAWFSCLHKLLTRKGILVMNFITPNALKTSAWKSDKSTRQLFPSTFRLDMDNYENIIGVFAKAEVDINAFKHRLRQYPELDQRRRTTKLQYRLRKLN